MPVRASSFFVFPAPTLESYDITAMRQSTAMLIVDQHYCDDANE